MDEDAVVGQPADDASVLVRILENGCALAVEFKKVFMDEWTGMPDPRAIAALRALVKASVPALERALRKVS